jgi:hypothetical protein
MLTFDRTGDHLLLGFDDGEICVISSTTPGTTRSEHLHRAPIRTLSLDPSGTWAFSADGASQQRAWKA